ncbi:hypothetical protein [Natronobacterium texcoconense]|uniref:Uncharacterized protein n=1 Tax=Natronobacterium texcoconense TaxID=1095778 RepID=A0A1H1G7D4_NATTX|nr:hypothetical protein [Natronobacterium texcoconense]SDR09110.1 hypothetical protein SAMN04489842_2298 [Natronobacterium texcoconense]
MTLQQITATDIAGWDSLETAVGSFEKHEPEQSRSAGVTEL